MIWMLNESLRVSVHAYVHLTPPRDIGNDFLVIVVTIVVMSIIVVISMLTNFSIFFLLLCHVMLKCYFHKYCLKPNNFNVLLKTLVENGNLDP